MADDLRTIIVHGQVFHMTFTKWIDLVDTYLKNMGTATHNHLSNGQGVDYEELWNHGINPYLVADDLSAGRTPTVGGLRG